MADEDNLETIEEVDNSPEEPIEEPISEEPSEEVEESYEDTSDTPEKFKSQEAQDKSYKELERKLSQLGEDNARMKEEIRLASMSPEEKEVADHNTKFIKDNNLMTKGEFQQMQKDQKEASSLISAGATQHQIDRVQRVSRYSDYSNMSITEIYRDLYGSVPKRKPKQGATQKPRGKSVKSNAYTKAQIDAMSADEYRKNYSDILARGVQS